MKLNKALFLSLGLGLIAGASLLSSCSSKQQTKSDSSILVVGVMPSLDHLPIAIALERGFFADSVQLSTFVSPMDRDAALQTGAVDASITDYMGAMLLHSKGQDVVLPIACQGNFRLVFGRDKELGKLSDLRDKHIGLSSNTLIDYATERALTDAAGKVLPYTRVEVQKIPIRLEMLRSGELDAAVLPEPAATLGASKGLKAISLPSGLVEHITGLVFQRKVYQARSKEIASFVEGYNKAVTYMQSQPRVQWADIIAKHLNIPLEVALQIPLPEYHTAAAPEEQDLYPILEWMKARKLVDPSYTTAGLIEALPQQQ